MIRIFDKAVKVEVITISMYIPQGFAVTLATSISDKSTALSKTLLQ